MSREKTLDSKHYFKYDTHYESMKELVGRLIAKAVEKESCKQVIFDDDTYGTVICTVIERTKQSEYDHGDKHFSGDALEIKIEAVDIPVEDLILKVVPFTKGIMSLFLKKND